MLIIEKRVEKLMKLGSSKGVAVSIAWNDANKESLSLEELEWILDRTPERTPRAMEANELMEKIK